MLWCHLLFWCSFCLIYSLCFVEVRVCFFCEYFDIRQFSVANCVCLNLYLTLWFEIFFYSNLVTPLCACTLVTVLCHGRFDRHQQDFKLYRSMFDIVAENLWPDFLVFFLVKCSCCCQKKIFIHNWIFFQGMWLVLYGYRLCGWMCKSVAMCLDGLLWLLLVFADHVFWFVFFFSCPSWQWSYFKRYA